MVKLNEKVSESNTIIEENMSETNLKPSDIVKNYLEKLPNIGNRTLATLLTDEFPDIFKEDEKENTRNLVRYYRGSSGKHNKHAINEKYWKQGLLPKEVKVNMSPFIIEEENVLLLADTHIPLHDSQAIECAIKNSLEVDCVLLNGDIIDEYMLSKWIRKMTHETFEDELEDVKDFLQLLYVYFKGKKIYYRFANHERRYENYCRANARDIADMKKTSLENLLCLNDFNCIPIKNKRTVKIAGLHIIHGDELPGGLVSSVNPARAAFLKTNDHTVVAHAHRSSEHNDRSISDKLISCWSVGCLCDLKPQFSVLNKWNHGFMKINRVGKLFKVENKRIEKGVLL